MDLLSIRWRRPRRSQVVPEHNRYPETPAVIEYFPAWKVHFEQTKNNTNHRLLIDPELNRYPVTPIPDQPTTAWGLHFEQTRNRTNRRLLAVTLNEYPPPQLSPATLPAYELWPTFKHKSRYKLLEVLRVNEYPETPPPEPVFRVGSMLAAQHVRRVMRRGR